MAVLTGSLCGFHRTVYTEHFLSCVAQMATLVVLWTSGSSREPSVPAASGHLTHLLGHLHSVPHGWLCPLRVFG